MSVVSSESGTTGVEEETGLKWEQRASGRKSIRVQMFLHQLLQLCWWHLLRTANDCRSGARAARVHVQHKRTAAFFPSEL